MLPIYRYTDIPATICIHEALSIISYVIVLFWKYNSYIQHFIALIAQTKTLKNNTHIYTLSCRCVCVTKYGGMHSKFVCIAYFRWMSSRTSVQPSDRKTFMITWQIHTYVCTTVYVLHTAMHCYLASMLHSLTWVCLNKSRLY